MTRVGIFGATGYTGHELMQILAQHPHAEIVALSSQGQSGIEVTLPRRAGQSLKQSKTLKLLSPEEALNVPMDAAFFCMPHGAGAKIAADALDAGIKVVDLSADYRLKSAGNYSATYGDVHPAPAAFEHFTYGLPELFRENIRTARGCANPGCYPTTVALALAPLLKKFSLAEGAPLIVDAKSGVSGAGRKPTESTHFISVHENFRPYNVGRSHRHVPEMEQTLNDYAPHFRSRILFTPGVLPVTRGMISSVYVPLSEPLTQTELSAIFEDFYQSEPFIHILGDGRATPDLSQVRGTNDAFISLHALDQTALVIVAIDNLVKGASGQAVQNFNLMMGFGETDGLLRTKTTH